MGERITCGKQHGLTTLMRHFLPTAGHAMRLRSGNLTLNLLEKPGKTSGTYLPRAIFLSSCFLSHLSVFAFFLRLAVYATNTSQNYVVIILVIILCT